MASLRILRRFLTSIEDEIGQETLIDFLSSYLSDARKQLNFDAPAPVPSSSLINQSAPSSPTMNATPLVLESQPKHTEKICPVCHDPVPAPLGCIAGGDGSHRRCLFVFGYSNWHDAVYGKNQPTYDSDSETSSPEQLAAPTETAPSSPIQSEIAAPTTPPRMNLVVEPPGAPKKSKIERTGVLEKPKKASKSTKQCEARILGERAVIPNTKHTLVYKPAQCSTMTTHSVKLDDDSIMPICPDCLKNYLARNDNPKSWHGFFDDGAIPATSHIVGGAWHTKKVAAAAKKATKASKDAESDSD